MRPLDEQNILITGATDGLGRALAERLAGHGARVIVHGRDQTRAQRAATEIESATGTSADTALADLATLGDVRRLAAQIRDRYDRLDALVSNAGIGTTVPGGGARQESADGYELRFAVNYLGGYLLTRLLLPTLVASAPARIVHVSSAGQAPIDFDNLMLSHDYSGVQAYCQSKLAQIMFTFDLADELADAGVTANALHPATYMPTKIVPSPISTLEEGVQSTLRLIADPGLDAVTGRYFNGLRDEHAHPQAYNRAARAKLRDLSERLTSV